MRVVDLIVKKRDGGSLDPDEIDFLVAGITRGTIPDYQTAALLMAIVWRGMTEEETWWLTDAMVRSGVRLDLREIPGPKADKHSTGGVGDKTSLVVAPLAVACGVKVPMMSGRALGHTGGTLDKLESIPGFRTELSVDELKAALRRVGGALVGQTAEIAPADRKLYALRDVTGTIESVPLITASIMSKKIAEGIEALVLDVKAGRGAFMKTVAEAERLAATLVTVGCRAGVRTQAFVTAMDAPLGRAVGNAIEVIECLETLKGRGPADLVSLSVQLAAAMVHLAGAATSSAEAEGRVSAALASGAALEAFRAIIAEQGGDARVVDEYARLPSAPYRALVRARRSGYVVRLDAELIGRASIALGAGRDRVGASIDPGVGLQVHLPVGSPVREGEGVLELLYRDEASLAGALLLAEKAIEIAEAPPPPAPIVLSQIGPT